MISAIESNFSQGAASIKSAPLLSPQHRERIRLLVTIFRAIDRHVEQGGFAQAEFQKFARRWTGSFYRSAPNRPVKFSENTLKRIYYGRWLRCGRNPEALHHHYRQPARITLTPAQRRTIIARAAQCGCMAQLDRLVFARCPRPPAHDLFRRTFTEAERQYLGRVFAARRQARRRERQFTAWLRHPKRSFATKGQP